MLFDNFGPYHHARIAAAAKVCELTGIEVRQRSTDYPWGRRQDPLPFRLHPLWGPNDAAARNAGGRAGAVNAALQQILPEAVMVPGWSSAAALAALRWCLRHRVPAVLMSESQAKDEPRSAWREAIKRQAVGCFSAALVGGSPHAEYLTQLGMPRDRVFLGYDAVDNSYFAGKAETLKAENAGGNAEKLKAEMLKYGGEGRGGNAEMLKAEMLKSGVRRPSSVLRPPPGMPERYFLASARFVEKKNLPRLLQAYALYRQKTEDGRPMTEGRGGKAETLKAEMLKGEGQRPEDGGRKTEKPWELVLLGDGPLRADLCRLISDLSLQNCVHLPGFKQYPDLPTYYGLASAFVHASTTEQWGLVVNEAMASGLPVLVSNRCGCAPDLVQEGVNGFTFDPYNVEKLAQFMLKISAFQPFSLSAFGEASRRIISEWGPERFASGLKAAVECALAIGPKRATLLDRVILRALAFR
jgi:glycosyltransferase involved in cell wall biosynthesis